MLKTLRKLAASIAAPGEEANEDESEALAVAALMLEAAAMDGRIDDTERGTILHLLAEAFDLAAADAAALLERARTARTEANQILHFTREIKDNVPFEERTEIMELLWQVVLADGEVHDYEANLMRRVAGLIHVNDRDSGRARKQAAANLGLPNADPNR